MELINDDMMIGIIIHNALGPRDCPRASPSGNLSGLGVQNPRPWEISWASGGVFSNTSLLSAVYGYNAHQGMVTDALQSIMTLTTLTSDPPTSQTPHTHMHAQNTPTSPTSPRC